MGAYLTRPFRKNGYNLRVPAPTLFDNLPASLFAPLAAPEAQAHARILSDLYAESRRCPHPLTLDIALDIIISHTIAPHTADAPLPQARETLRYLETCGWLRTETQPDFTTACLLTPHAFQILQSLSLDSPSILELLIAIHDLLKAALLDVDNDHRLREAARLAFQLHNRLKELQHNSATLSAIEDTTRLRSAVIDAAAKLETRGHPPARYIRETIQSLDRLLDDITARQTRLAAATDHPPASATQLAAIITRLAASDKKTFAKHAEPLIHLYCQTSTQTPNFKLQTPNIQAPNHLTTQLPNHSTAQPPSDSEIESARREIARQLRRPITRDRVRRAADSILRRRPEARAADLIAADVADLPLLAQLRIHGDGSLGYRIEDGAWIELNGLGFRDFVMTNLNYTPPPVDLPPIPAEDPDIQTPTQTS